MSSQDHSFGSEKDITLKRVEKFQPQIALSPERFHQFLEELEGLPEKWLAPIVLWFQGKADNTIDAYGRALADFLVFTDKTPDEITWKDIVAFKDYLLEEVGNKPKTVLHKLNGISSYFDTLGQPIGPDGKPLVRYNPVEPVDLKALRVRAESNSNPTDLDDFVKILKEIDRDSEKGARDWVLLNWVALCGHRRHELASLQGKDLWEGSDGQYIYRYPLKGSGTKEKVVPEVILEWLRDYLEKSGRSLEGLHDEEGVFISSATNRDTLCRDNGHEFLPPIDEGTISWVLKSYAEDAKGVDPTEVTPHGLRHLGAHILETLTNDPREVQKLLDHQTVSTTENYLNGLEEQVYENFDTMFESLFDALEEEIDDSDQAA